MFSDDDKHNFTAVGLTKVQGLPAFAIVTIRNSEVMSIIPINPERESTALEEVRKLIIEMKEVAE